MITTLAGNVAAIGLARSGTPSLRSRLAALAEILSPAPRSAFAANGLDGIRVSVIGLDLSTETDETGQFQLTGAFAGAIDVLFETPDGLVGTISTVVPRGGKLVLRDVDLGDGSSAPRASRHVEFEGVFVDKDCISRTADIASRFEPEGLVFPVDLGSTLPRTPSGLPMPCLAIQNGAAVVVHGTLDPVSGIIDACLDLQDRVLPELDSVPTSSSMEGSTDLVGTLSSVLPR